MQKFNPIYRNNISLIFIILIIFFLLSPYFLFAEKDVSKDETSLNKERISIIKYGIDTEVLDLIKKLKKEKDFSLDDNLLQLLSESQNNKLKSAIIDLFSEDKNNSKNLGRDFIFSELKNNYDLSVDLKTQYISYLATRQTKEITDFFITLIDHENETIANSAIDAIGKSGVTSYSKILLKSLKDNTTSETKKMHLIEALGKLKSKNAISEISKYLKNDYTTNRSLKWKACIALGEIGDEKSLPVIKSLFADKDPYLRNYAVEALQYFPGTISENLIIEGLRDSSWRVRVSAAKSLGKLKSKKSVPVLIYKVKHDPDIKNVRNASIKALGQIGTKESLDFLKKFILDDKSNISNKYVAVQTLIDDDLDNSLETIKDLINKEWDKPTNSQFLDYVCKLLSEQKNNNLKPVYLKMLKYTKTINLKIYGLRGIKRNSFTSLTGEVKKLTDKNTPKQIKKVAEDVLASLK